jgi:hypothetical protein
VLELDAGVSTDRGAKKLVVQPEVAKHLGSEVQLRVDPYRSVNNNSTVSITEH